MTGLSVTTSGLSSEVVPAAKEVDRYEKAAAEVIGFAMIAVVG